MNPLTSKPQFTRFSHVFVALIVSCVAPVPPLATQVAYGLDVGLSSRYLWRGLTRDGGWVVQPDVFLSYRRGGAVATLGEWATFDVGSRSPDALRLALHTLGENDPWLEVGCHCLVDIAAGWTRHIFARGAQQVVPTQNGSELYGRIQDLDLPYVVPQFGLWYNESAEQGTYLELSLGIRVPVWPAVILPLGSLTVTPIVGYTSGPSGRSGGASEPPYFAGSGITHYAVDAAIAIGQLPFWKLSYATRLETRFQRNKDPNTMFLNLAHRAPTQWSFAFTFTALAPRCNPAHSLCPR
jgi:hypothetical protein